MEEERSAASRANWCGDRRFAEAEWKLDDRIGYEDDKAWLKANSSLMQVGYDISRTARFCNETHLRKDSGREGKSIPRFAPHRIHCIGLSNQPRRQFTLAILPPLARLPRTSSFALCGGAVMLRPRICHVLSVLKIHRPDCEHCMARLTCGHELRKRLEELNARTPSPSHEKRDSKVA